MLDVLNNKVFLNGIVSSAPQFNHEIFSEKFYKFFISVYRRSGTADVIPVLISERSVDINKILLGKSVEIKGQFRSFNIREGERNRLSLFVFAKDIDFDEKKEEFFINQIFLDGYICKLSKCRETPKGRKISDLILAVHRFYKKSDYIPCIAWERNADYISNLKLGTRIKLDGRIQSREYKKPLGDSEFEYHVAYEVSIGKVEVIENADKN